MNFFSKYDIISNEILENNENQREIETEQKGAEIEENPYEHFIKFSTTEKRKSFFPIKTGKKMTIFEMNELLKIRTTFFQNTRENWKNFIKDKIDLKTRKKVFINIFLSFLKKPTKINKFRTNAMI